MNFKFHGLYNGSDKKQFKSAQEEDLKKICDYLNIPLNNLKKIKFEIFDTREGKQNADPHHSISRSSARFKEMTVYRFWKSSENSHFPHELTHLVAHTWVEPYIWKVKLSTWDKKTILKTIEMVSTSFMQEGLAIAVDDIVFKRKLLENGERKFIDDWCKEQLNKFPSLKDTINFEGFCSFENKLVIPFCASLSKYLIMMFGLNKYKKAYVSVQETNSPNRNVKLLEKIYDLQINDLLNNWRLWVSQ